MPVVSIIVPVYNTEKYIMRCVDSILSQGFIDFEILLVNDGSTDASGEFCDLYAKRDKRIIAIHQNNGGVSAARNAGLSQAKGKYVIFVDSDDELAEDSLQILLSAALLGEYNLIIGDCCVIGSNQKYDLLCADNEIYSSDGIAVEMMLRPETGLLMSAVWGKLFSNDLIREFGLLFNADYANGEDGLFIDDYLRYTGNIYNVKSPVYKLYRYDEAERISAVSAFYPDFFEFHLIHSGNLWEIAKAYISDSDRKAFMNKVIDNMIMHLVRAAVCEDFFQQGYFLGNLKGIVKMELVVSAIREYRRINPDHSVFIPLFIRMKMPRLLYHALRARTKVYRKTHKDPIIVKSIYRHKKSAVT